MGADFTTAEKLSVIRGQLIFLKIEARRRKRPTDHRTEILKAIARDYGAAHERDKGISVAMA